MTFATTCIGLFPILWATGAGSDVMKRIAAPMVGGIFTSFLLELLVYPAIYEVWRWNLAVKPKQDSSSVGFGEKSATDLTLNLPPHAPRTTGD
jgi:Cu(I)/Ag(I) efflux system membrane protein CusA/SilA